MTAMRRRRLLGLAILVLWVVLGPIGMAFDSCAAMMALCDGGPCGVVAAVTEARPTLGAPEASAVVDGPVRTPLPAVAVRAPEPPPKSLPRSA